MNRLPICAAAVLGAALSLGCAYHSPSAPSGTTQPAADLTPAALHIGLASRDDRRLNVIIEVLSSDGHPVPNVSLTLTIAEGTVTPNTLQTDATGYARAIADAPGVTTLIVTGASLSQSIRVDGNTTPTADLSVRLSASGATVGNATTFGIATSMVITRADWDFGDGTIANTISGSTTHIYGRSGVFAASVTVADNAGHTETAGASVTIAPAPVEPPPTPTPPPSLSIVIACTRGDHAAVLTACNVAATYGGAALLGTAVSAVSWDWSDGSNSTSTMPVGSHQYALPGMFLVTADVTAMTADGPKTAKAVSTVTIPQ